MENETQQKNILEVIRSSGMYDKLETLGGKYGLLLDQVGQLEVRTRLTLLGKFKSADFTKSIASDLEIPMSTAEKITADIGTQIFTPLKESMRKAQEESEKSALARPSITPPPPIAPPVSPIEKAGNFNIIRQPSSYSPQYNHDTLDKDAVLHDLENIEKLKPQNANNFVEHLLTTPVSSPPAIPKKPAPPVTPRKDGVDPYREQV